MSRSDGTIYVKMLVTQCLMKKSQQKQPVEMIENESIEATNTTFA